MEHAHTPEAIRARLAAPRRHSYLRDWVYGGVDGAVTTFAVVSGVEGANLSTEVILILGFANLLADGFSMAAGDYLATKTEHEELEQVAAMERRHIETAPEGERAEVREIYRQQGLSGEALEQVVDAITSDRKRWVDTMLTHEFGLTPELRRAWPAALNTFAAFALCGGVPLAPFLAGTDRPFAVAAACTGLVFFGIGALKSRWSVRRWWRSGLETLAIGAVAAALAYGAGAAVRLAIGG
jgi:VIT1/CCC1 family predicted Fe2+/Mn2+ transporter